MKRVLFVCLGNICRSPLAQALFEKEIEERGLSPAVAADSCGCSGWHSGDLPDPRMRTEAARHGVDLTHRARKITNRDGSEFDYIFAMDEEIYDRLSDELGEKYWNKIRLFREWDQPDADGSRDVPDPYYGGREGFAAVYDICERNCRLIADRLFPCND